VRTEVVSISTEGERVSLSGKIQARDQVSFSFRMGGRMIARPVAVGETVKAGQVLARLEAKDATNSLQSAEAELADARATLTKVQRNEQRHAELRKTGAVSAAQYEDAQQQLASAQSRVKAVEAQVRSARDALSYTQLTADSEGVVTAVGAEPGEVVAAGQSIVEVAQGDARDAVFDVPASVGRRTGSQDPEVTVALAHDESISVHGRVGEVSPQADPVTGTYQVKVGLENPPDPMRLGATIVGTAVLGSAPLANLPVSALTQDGDAPAVWIVDPRNSTVSLHRIGVARYDDDSILVDEGLNNGDIVVTAGAHSLHAGQKVRLLPESS